MDGQDGEGDADVGDGTDVGGHGAAGSDERDVDDLNRGADDDARRDVAEYEADDETADQGTAEGVVTDGGAAHARQGRQAGEQAKQRSLQNVDSHKRQTTFLCVVREARRAPVT